MLEAEGRQCGWFIDFYRDGGRQRADQAGADLSGAEALVGEERFYGCPFINAVAEHDKDQKQFRAIAMKHKKVVLAHIEKLAARWARRSGKCWRISSRC